MFAGKPTRVVTALVICSQIASSLLLSVAIPAPQSMAREGRIALEASDVMIGQLEREEAQPQIQAEEPSIELTDEPYAWEEDLPGDWQAACAAEEPPAPAGPYDADELRTQGVIYDGATRYTWYSQRVLPGGGLDIEGRHVSEEGYVVDADERIVVASSDLAHGTEIDVPFGSGKAVVLDTGCASGTIDVYTDF